ncbi:FAD-dependent monooxygenase [Saccharopolyspora pogona]|uniref:FAD-dependent monooxygenase n=1 Tax=Saccharopolyspora pogona TaxID=333966 RepID=UPI0037C8D45E
MQRIDSVVLERRSQEHVQHRVRAGVLEQGTVDLLRETGGGDRILRKDEVHGGVHLQFDEERLHIPFLELTGRAITGYGQQEVVKDLGERRQRDGGQMLFARLPQCHPD